MNVQTTPRENKIIPNIKKKYGDVMGEFHSGIEDRDFLIG
jgi:hypothetical protein